MNDDRLNRLKTVAVPPPSEKARLAAADAAMAAFDKAGEDEASVTQGSVGAARPKTSFIAKAWSWLMTKPFVSRPVAATLLILPVAGVIAYGYLTQLDLPLPQSLPREAKTGKIEMARDGRSSEPQALGGAVRSEPSLQSTADPAGSVETTETDRGTGNRSGDVLQALTEQQAGDASSVDEIREVGPSLGADPKREQGTFGMFDKSDTDAAAPAPAGEPVVRLRVDRPVASGRVNRSAGEEVASAPVEKSRRLQGNANALKQQPEASLRAKPSVPQNDQAIIRPEAESRDQFAEFKDNDARIVADQPVTTFSIDVDTASYAFVRRALEGGRLPPRDAVRVEEMINYFPYDYPAPDRAEEPFRASVALYPTPWNPQTRLMHIGIKGFDVTPEIRPAANLVFLIDVSGSMDEPDKLPLLKSAFRMLVNQLGPEDSVAIVTYAGHAGTVLEPTAAREKQRILAAIDNLRPGGSTAGAAGIEQAYRLAEQGFKPDGVNRVVLATDGDFNVGISDPDQLKRFIEKKRSSGTFLSVLGFGEGNYNDALMQALAQNGNGIAAYIDNLNEARKVLVEEAAANLFPIASDVKIQVEFNPARVSEYRLIGYETRALRNRDFNDDRIDAGDIGSGHTVTAIYELTLAGSATSQLDDRRYAQSADAVTAEPVRSDEYGFLKLRYKLPNEDRSTLVSLPVTDALASDALGTLSEDMRFAAAVAAFGQKLRDNRALDDFSYDDIAALASSARGADPFGYRGEFLSLVRLAGSLQR